jgi:predicted transcriptional regulator
MTLMQAAPVGKLHTIQAREAMRAPVIAVESSAAFADVAMLMGGLQVHCVIAGPVDILGGHRTCGVISDLDLIRGAISGAPLPAAGAITTTATPCVDAGDDLQTVCAALLEHGRSSAIVLDAGMPIGVISTLDIALQLGR